MAYEYAIETKMLKKIYGEQVAVNNVSLHIPKGHIYGLLGRNGAGKTSIMKLLLRLISATSGEVYIFGQPVINRERRLFKRIGAIIETPGFYSNLTGTENLEIFAKLRGVTKPHAVEHALELVGLPYRDKKLFGEYSLGMKQRLGIANAIMHDPDLLILDEPINGLDPIGIAEVREFIRKLRRKDHPYFKSYSIGSVDDCRRHWDSGPRCSFRRRNHGGIKEKKSKMYTYRGLRCRKSCTYSGNNIFS